MSQNGGFTLIELILVTVIIGILAGMVTLTFQGRAEEARVRAAKGDIASYTTAIDLYALDHNDQYPPSLEALAGGGGKRKYVRELNTEPWGQPLRLPAARAAQRERLRPPLVRPRQQGRWRR